MKERKEIKKEKDRGRERVRKIEIRTRMER
jgi:hypothetical protein